MKFSLRRKLTDENIMAYEPTEIPEPRFNPPSKISKIITNIEDKTKQCAAKIGTTILKKK